MKVSIWSPSYVRLVRDSFVANCRGCKLSQPETMRKMGIENGTLIRDVLYEDHICVVLDDPMKSHPKNIHYVCFLKMHAAKAGFLEILHMDDALRAVAEWNRVEGFRIFYSGTHIPDHYHRHLAKDYVEGKE